MPDDLREDRINQTSAPLSIFGRADHEELPHVSERTLFRPQPSYQPTYRAVLPFRTASICVRRAATISIETTRTTTCRCVELQDHSGCGQYWRLCRSVQNLKHSASATARRRDRRATWSTQIRTSPPTYYSYGVLCRDITQYCRCRRQPSGAYQYTSPSISFELLT